MVSISRPQPTLTAETANPFSKHVLSCSLFWEFVEKLGRYPPSIIIGYLASAFGDDTLTV